MDELGEITDYTYEVASDDALIIRGLSIDPELKEEISVTVIATGFEPNSIFQPYKPAKPQVVPLNLQKPSEPQCVIQEEFKEKFVVQQKPRHAIVSDIDDELQIKLDFGLFDNEPSSKTASPDEETHKTDSTLRKVKHMQNMLKKEGFTGYTLKDNIEAFEDVPAYVRKNLNIGMPDKKASSKVSKFTLSTDGEEGPVLREDNAYLNDNVD